MTIRRIPPGDTFQRMSRPLSTEVTPYPIPGKNNPGGSPLSGGILDVDSFHVGNIGNQVTLNLPAAATFAAFAGTGLWNNPPALPPNCQRTVVLQAQARNPANPKTLTVSINSLTEQNNFAGALDCDIKAIINFGSGANRNLAIVDIGPGIQLGITAGSIVIEATYNVLSDISTAFPFNIGAQLGYSPISRTVRPTFTARFFQLAPGGAAVTFSMPPYAREVFVLGADTLTQLSVPITVRILTAGGPLGGFTVPVNGEKFWTPVPITPTTSVVVSNPAANPNPINGAVIWGLAL